MCHIIISFNLDAARLTSDEEHQLSETMEDEIDGDASRADPDHIPDSIEEDTFAGNINKTILPVKGNKCPQCAFATEYTSNLKRHIKTRHTHKDDRPHKCTKCDYAAKLKEYLARHMEKCKN